MRSPPRPPSRTDLFECHLCKQQRPGADFVTLVTVPALVGDSERLIRRGPNKGKFQKYSRAEHRKRIIDPTRPCRACRAKAASRAHYDKTQARIEQARAEARAEYDKAQQPMPADLLPRAPRLLKGDDPVLAQLNVLLANARARVKREKEGVRLRVTDGNTEYHTTMMYLLRARIAVFKMVRHQRHIDLQNPQLTNDMLRMHWRAYVDRSIRNDMDDLARKVNALAPRGSRRPWKGLPSLVFVDANKPAPDGTPRKEFVCAQAWQPMREQIRHALAASHAALRNPRRNTDRNVPVYGQGNQGRVDAFSVADFHHRRIECARAAEQEIDRAIEDYVHPANWASPWMEGATPSRGEGVSTWRALVPPLLRNEIEWMWQQMPPGLQKRLLPFPRLHEDKRNGFQILNRLDANNVPLPPPAPAFAEPDHYEREVSMLPDETPSDEHELPIVTGLKRKPVPVYKDEQGNWRPVPQGGHEDGLEKHFRITDVTKEGQTK